MKHSCPYCRTEMVERCNLYVCPMNDIGDCAYNAFEFVEENCQHPGAIISQNTGSQSFINYDYPSD